MPFLNHRLRTLQTESFRNLGAAFSPSLFLFLSLNFVPKYLKISFLPLCIYKNVEKNRAKTGHFLLQFLPSNHNILWSSMPIFLIFHNTASELPTPHAPSLGTDQPAGSAPYDNHGRSDSPDLWQATAGRRKSTRYGLVTASRQRIRILHYSHCAADP